MLVQSTTARNAHRLTLATSQSRYLALTSARQKLNAGHSNIRHKVGQQRTVFPRPALQQLSVNRLSVKQISLSRPALIIPPLCLAIGLTASTATGTCTPVVFHRLNCEPPTSLPPLLAHARESKPAYARFKEVVPDSEESPWHFLWRVVLRPDWPLLLAVAICAVATAVVNLTTPRVIGKLVNIVSRTMTSSSTLLTSATSSLLAEINRPAMHLLALLGAQGLLTFAAIALVSVLGERAAVRLRLELFEAILRQDMGFFDEQRTGELVGRLTTDVGDFKHAFKNCVSQGLKSATQIVGSFVQLMALSGQLTTGILLAIPLMYGFGNGYGAHLRKLSREAKAKDGVAAGVAGESFANIKTVRSFANEQHEQRKLFAALGDASTANERLGFHIGAFQGLTNMSISGMVLVVLYFGGGMVARGDMTGGDLMSYLISIQNAQKSLAQLGVLFAQGVKAASSLGRIHEYVRIAPAISLRGGSQLPAVSGHIQFDHVRFAYPTRPGQTVLQDLTLDIPQGKVVALCGYSGAGKSTVAHLIERFYDPLEGEIRLDGVPLKDLDPSWMRQQIGYIHQEPILFADSILENIRYSKPDATLEEVRTAARLANAADFIESFPQQYDTVVGERGVTLSGGQKQRIAIARVLLKNPRILILDEATSALDAHSERMVQDVLDRLLVGRTVVVIAHRLSTIEKADVICVMERGGHVVETGTHGELMARRGAYYKLHTRASATGVVD